MTCELCDLIENRNIITEKYYEDAKFMMVDCKSCGVPMLVSKNHGVDVDQTDIDMAYALFWRALKEKKADFSMSKWWVDKGMRKIPGHWHVHLRRR